MASTINGIDPTMKSPLNAYNPADFKTVKQIALSFPETEESVSHEGTPSVKIRGKLMCRLHESGSFIPIRLNFELRDQYLDSHPELFHLPDHFKNYPYLCMWTHCHDIQLLKEVLTLSWRELATKKTIKAFEQANNKI